MRASESKTCGKILLNKEEGDKRNKWHKKIWCYTRRTTPDKQHAFKYLVNFVAKLTNYFLIYKNIPDFF